MGYLALYAGLLLPWVVGAIWLVVIERRANTTQAPNLFRQIGYGFFLGYAGLVLMINLNHRLSGSVSWPGLMLVLTVMAIAGGLFLWLSPKMPVTALSKELPAFKSKPLFWFTMLLLGWIAVHFLIYAVDVFTQPVYPWDAWLAWVYRAKAWFLSGGMANVVGTSDWIEQSTSDSYTINAWRYPALPSVIPYWAALSLGYWSETLVNVPVLFAALAIGMALYGQCREVGLSITSGVLSCYLLYSIPLFGTHIALAGYADIWMAGFSGLGFIALIRALAQRHFQGAQQYRIQMVLAFVFLALAVMVKNEGAVWLLTAVIMLVIHSFRARVPILILVSFGLLLLLVFAFGVTHVSVPILGTIGFVDDRLFIPFIGNFALELHNIGSVYLSNFFAMGSWNLFWVLVLAAMAIAMRSNSSPPDKQFQRIGLSFICIFLVTQFFIFGLTDQGLWADTFTAINRLPLHFLPALLFAVFIIPGTRIDQPVSS